MERARVNGVELEYEVRGSGEPVVLLHGGLLADENTPLAKEPALTDRYQVINYHRRGFAGSTRVPDSKASIDDQVADCKALLDHLGVEKTHVCGHSLGGVIGIQLALSHPDTVQDLALMEPAIMGAVAKAEATIGALLVNGRPVALPSNSIQNLGPALAGLGPVLSPAGTMTFDVVPDISAPHLRVQPSAALAGVPMPWDNRILMASEPIVDADLMGAQAQLKAIIEDHRQYVIAQIGILVDGDCMTRGIRL